MTTAWRRSSRCGTTSCIEVQMTAAGIRVRDSKDPAGPHLTFPPYAWRTFVAAVTADQIKENP